MTVGQFYVVVRIEFGSMSPAQYLCITKTSFYSEEDTMHEWQRDGHNYQRSWVGHFRIPFANYDLRTTKSIQNILTCAPQASN